eukprot:3908444-Pleurochrysis_carterae.AAC.1
MHGRRRLAAPPHGSHRAGALAPLLRCSHDLWLLVLHAKYEGVRSPDRAALIARSDDAVPQ